MPKRQFAHYLGVGLKPTPAKIILFLLLILILPAQAQEGSGSLVIGYSGGTINPLLCTTADCRRASDLLFPYLVRVDQGQFTPASGTEGLALSWEISGAQIVFNLRDDLRWSDGAPLTAYDVFYSYLALASGDFPSVFEERIAPIVAAAPLDATRIAFVLNDATCSALDAANIPVIPAHVFEADFAQIADQAFNGDDLAAEYAAWQENQQRDFAFLRDHPFNDDPVTAGAFHIVERRPQQYLRLAANETANGSITPLGVTFEFNPDGHTEPFLRGEFSLLFNIPHERRNDVRAIPDVQIFEHPSASVYYIALNFADPLRPRSLYDENGVMQEQRPHPIFADWRVRRALQLALDVEQMIQVGYNGEATPIPANISPVSWAYNPDLQRISFNLTEAAALLDQAGWRDIGFNGTRECVTCINAVVGSSLSFGLIYPDGLEPIAREIQRTFGTIGVNLSTSSYSEEALIDEVQDQTFDAYLWRTPALYPFDPDQSRLFSREYDVVGEFGNNGSYYNPQVEMLLEQARTTADCDIDARAAIYRDLQVVLQDDQPFLWLYAPNVMIAAQSGVRGIDPVPGEPLWNVSSWIVEGTQP